MFVIVIILAIDVVAAAVIADVVVIAIVVIVDVIVVSVLLPLSAGSGCVQAHCPQSLLVSHLR